MTVQDIAAAMTALGTILTRRCLDATRRADAEVARELSRRLVELHAPIEIIAVATVGVYAGLRPDDDMDEDVLTEVVPLIRQLAGTYDDDGLTMLAATALVLVVRRGWSDRPGHDLVRAAQALWSLEHHELTVAVCREALASHPLEQLDEATALMLVARVTHDPADVERLRASSEEWSTEVADKVDVRSLVVPGERRDDRLWDLAREALLRGDRAESARLMAEVTSHLLDQSSQDRVFLEGLRRGFAAMATAEVDVENLRIGLVDVVRQIRGRQRFGNIPPAARSGLELLLLILVSDANAARGSVLAELLEALADAGLSEVDLPTQTELPLLAEAELAEKAKHFPLWPDLAACVEGLDGNFCILSRRVGGGRSAGERWITMFIAPPGSVMIRSGVLTAERVEVLERLNPGTGLVGDVTQAELDDLLLGFLRPEAVEMLQAQPDRGLVVVPDGPQWSVPWQAATVLRSRPVTIAPSTTLYSRLGEPPHRLRSVVALIDTDVEGADRVLEELTLARERGLLDVTFDASSLDQECDLMIVLGHGSGDGLSFRLAVGAGLTAHDVARRTRARTALVACCGSARTPPVALPINLPASLLMRGCTHCVGGIWLVPQAPTSALVAAAVAHIAAGRTLTEAITLGRAGSVNLLDDWGMVSTGAIPGWESSGG